jgi:hypothetical protein
MTTDQWDDWAAFSPADEEELREDYDLAELFRLADRRGPGWLVENLADYLARRHADPAPPAGDLPKGAR